jgi:microsomal epoxide hydrolase
MVKLIPSLTDPAAHGGRAEDAFDVVVPSLPGYGFSDRPSEHGFGKRRIADLFDTLMTAELGYEGYDAHGGDWGSAIAGQFALHHATALVGIHLTDIPFGHLFTGPSDDLTEAAQKYLKSGQAWQMTVGAYAFTQSTKQQTLAYGLNDSPAGLAAWIVVKFRSWSDCDGDVEKRVSNDELLANITHYWVTGTINSANRLYHEFDLNENPSQAQQIRPDVPTGVAIFPKDIVPAPRAFTDRFFNVQRRTDMPRGGHFAALEEPELLAEDLRAFFRPFRQSSR